MVERKSLFHQMLKALRKRRTPVARCKVTSTSLRTNANRPALVVVEGFNDMEFLRRASAVLRASDHSLPEIGQLERTGHIAFVPTGGDAGGWAFRLASLGMQEFFLIDREDSPATQIRTEVARIINFRPGCRAVVTVKRSVENYLHPRAILEARGIDVSFGDNEDVADLVAQRSFQRQHPGVSWIELSTRSRGRMRNHAKHWLNSVAVDRMTPERFAERDPAGEIIRWLTIIGEMASDSL